MNAAIPQNAGILYAYCNSHLQIGEEGTCGNYKIRHDSWTVGSPTEHQIANFRLWRSSPFVDLGSCSLDCWSDVGGRHYDGDKLYVRYLGSGGAPCEAHYELGDLTPELTITGGYLCWISENTYTGGERVDVSAPRVWAQVRIYDGNGNFLGSGLTGDDGRFSITVTNPGDTGFYVKTLPHTGACHVTRENGSDYIDRRPENTTLVYKPSLSDTTSSIGDNIQVVDRPGYREAWRIYETITNDAYDRGAWNFLTNKGPGYTPPMVNVTYPSYCTGYDSGAKRILIKESYHTKALDVVQHEYGHFIMDMLYGHLPTAGCSDPHHEINTSWNPGLSHCAWLEGWAEFFPLAVQDEHYFEYGSGNDDDLEKPTWNTPGWEDGDYVEGRVAGALNDIFDDYNPDEGYDTVDDGFLNIWDVVHGQTDDNFAEFYEAWKDRGHDIPKANAAIFQNTIDYNNRPSCEIISPDGGGRYSGKITVSASASDDTGGYVDGTVSQVEFEYYDHEWHDIGTDTSPTGGWSTEWDTGSLTDSTVWVRARAMDNLGEESDWDESDDSFGVDNKDPPEPSTSSLTHPDEDKWFDDDDPSFEWDTPEDPSGIEGYSYVSDQSGSTIPDKTIDTTGNSKSYTDVADGIWYFHIRAKDNTKNWGSADHYRVKIDTENPPAPVISSQTHPDEHALYSNNDPSFTWTTPSDTSGIACYSYILDQSPTTTPDITCEPAGNSGSYTDVAAGIRYFHVRAKDNAGNWGSADHYGVNICGGEASTIDACIALAIAAGSREYDPRWDVSGDGRVTSLDALMILQAADSEP